MSSPIAVTSCPSCAGYARRIRELIDERDAAVKRAATAERRVAELEEAIEAAPCEAARRGEAGYHCDVHDKCKACEWRSATLREKGESDE